MDYHKQEINFQFYKFSTVSASIFYPIYHDINFLKIDMMLKTKYRKNNLPALFLKLMREIGEHSCGFLFSLIIPLALGLRGAQTLCFFLVLVSFVNGCFGDA